MPVKSTQIPDIPSYRGEDKELQSILDRVRTAISHLTKTDFVTEKDIHCKSLYVDGDSLHIGGITLKKPKDTENEYVLVFDRKTRELKFAADISDTVLAKALAHASEHENGGADEISVIGLSGLLADAQTPLTENVQDIVGAMLSGNTETLIAATYQDADGTIDLVVDEASIDHDALTNFVANEHLPGIDEDDMISDSVVHVPTQQSVKAYADLKLPLAGGILTGDLLFSGVDTGLPYGSMYSITDMAITMTTQNVWYEVDAAAAWVTGKLNNCTFTDPYITVTNAGTYLITWNIGVRIDTANQVVRCGIMIDRTVTDNPAHGLPGVQGEGRGTVEFLNSARRLNTSGSAILTLAASRTISLAVRNITSAAKVLTVGLGNLKVVQIGG